MIARLSNVDLRAGEYIVQTYSQTEDGFWVLDGQPIRLPSDASPGELGQATKDALEVSRQDIANPPREANTARPLLEMLGLRDYATYARGTRSVGVRADDTPDGEQIKITPKRNGGARNGFTPLKEHQIAFSYDSPGQLGKALIEAFEHATA